MFSSIVFVSRQKPEKQVETELAYSTQDPARILGSANRKHEQAGQTFDRSPPPYKNKKLSTRSEEPETRGSGHAGVLQKQDARNPDLRNVQKEDLDSPSCLYELFRQAVEEGLVRPSDMDRLKFFAAAEHACAVGTKNRCGLFIAIVRRGLWQHISLCDEDAARAKLRRLAEDGGQRSVVGQKCKIAPKEVPEDRLLEVAGETERAKIRKAIAESLGLGPSERTLQAG